MLLLLCCVFSVPPVFAQQTGSINGKVTDTGGAVLPGVTVEARSTVLPGPRESVTAGDGTYQLTALPPGTYTVTFSLDGMQTVTRTIDVQLGEEYGGRCDAAGCRRQRDRHRHRRIADDRQGVGIDHQRVVERSDQESAGRHAVSRLDQPDSRGAIHAGPGPRPERGRQRSGQRLQLRRRQRHAAAVRHALSGAGVARHRADHGRQRGRQGDRLQPRRWFRCGLGQQVRHQHVPRPRRLPLPDGRHGLGAEQRQRVALRPGSRLDRPQRRRPYPARSPLLLRLVLSSDGHPQQRVDRLRPGAQLRQRPQRGVRQADADADAHHAGQRQLSVVASARHRHAVQPVHGGNGGDRQ